MTTNSHCWNPGLICGEVKFILLLSWNWYVEMMGVGDHKSASSCRMGEVEGVGTVELVCVGRLLRMGCDSFVMPMCWSVGSGEPGSRMGYHGNIPLRINVGKGGRDRKSNSLAGRAEAENLILWLVVLKFLVDELWLCEAQSLIQGLLETFCIPGFENVSPGDGSDCQTG